MLRSLVGSEMCIRDRCWVCLDEEADLASKWHILTEFQMRRIWMENNYELVERIDTDNLIEYCKGIFDAKNIIYVEDTWKNKLATVIDPVQKLT